MKRCKWCKHEIFWQAVNCRWVHVETFDHRMTEPACEPDMQSTLAAPEPEPEPEPEPIEDDAWQLVDDLRKRFTKTWEVRPDLEVTALGTQRSVRLRVGDWTFEAMSPKKDAHECGPQITDRNVKTMRELGEALLAACDFVEKANPKWASHPPLPPIVILGPR